MRILVVGAGGVGGALVPIAKRRSFFGAVVVADYDRDRAGRVVDRADDARFRAAEAHASDGRALRGGLGAIDQIAVHDGAHLVVEGYDFAPSFSIWTTSEECLNPPLIWEKDRGWFTTAPFSEPETFIFPDGIGPVDCVNVEHEEVVLI